MTNRDPLEKKNWKKVQAKALGESQPFEMKKIKGFWFKFGGGYNIQVGVQVGITKFKKLWRKSTSVLKLWSAVLMKRFYFHFP